MNALTFSIVSYFNGAVDGINSSDINSSVYLRAY